MQRSDISEGGEPGTIVIIGAGLAGGTAATALRSEGYAGRLVLVGEEPVAPYERPALSKAFLRGASTAEEIASRPPASYDDIETRFGVRAAGIDTTVREVVLSDGEVLGYDRLLLATGSRNRRPALPGLDLPGVHDLRSLADAEALRADARPGGRAVVLGMGLVGSELAASLRILELDVTIVELLELPLAHVLGEEVSAVVRSVHAEHGVTMVTGRRATAIEAAGGRAAAVTLDDGTRLPCDLVVFGFGAEPVVDLAVAAGIHVDNGVVVDQEGRTSAPDVWAVGDVSNHWHPMLGRQVRVEHWQHAVLQSRVVARNLLGAHDAYGDVPWFWTDQYDVTVHHAGFHEQSDARVVRGSLDERRFVVFHLAQGRLVGATGVNSPRDVRFSMDLIAARAKLSPEALADPAVPLRSLLTS